MRYRGVHQLLRDRLLAGLGLADVMPWGTVQIERLRQTEWDPLFERRMRARLVMGALRYGSIQRRRSEGIRYDYVGDAISRLLRYRETGNQELLVDAANLCLMEHTMGCCHPSPRWAPSDDGQHARRI